MLKTHFLMETHTVIPLYIAGVDGFIVVDLPPEEAAFLSGEAQKNGLAYIPLVSPTTTEERMAKIGSVAHGFVYCVSLTGVTGARTELPANLDVFMAKSTSMRMDGCLAMRLLTPSLTTVYDSPQAHFAPAGAGLWAL
jgi:hypothetical protein